MARIPQTFCKPVDKKIDTKLTIEFLRIQCCYNIMCITTFSLLAYAQKSVKTRLRKWLVDLQVSEVEELN